MQPPCTAYFALGFAGTLTFSHGVIQGPYWALRGLLYVRNISLVPPSQSSWVERHIIQKYEVIMLWVQLLQGLPLLYLGLSGVAFALSLHSPKQSQRLALLPLILIPAFLSLSSVRTVPFAPGLSLVWGQTLTGYILHTISTLHLQRISPPVQEVSDSKVLRPRGGFDFLFFCRLWLNPRLIRINPSGSEFQDKSVKRSRGVFLLLQCSKLFLYYIIQMMITPALFDEIVIDIIPSDVAPYQQSLLRPLDGYTTRECLNVAFITLSSFWTTFVYLDGTNALLAIFFVTIGLHDPEDWPPLFGNISLAVGLRNFWSKVWHTLPMKPYKSIGEFVSLKLFRLSTQSLAHKSTIAFVAFGLSGGCHALIDWQRGSPYWHLDIYWFLLNFLGCTGEFLLVRTLHHLARKIGVERDFCLLKESWLGRFVGYIWVCAFFCWTVPMWRFPDIHRESLAYHKMKQLMSNIQIV